MAVESDKSSALHEIPQGLKSVFALPHANRLEHEPYPEPPGRGNRAQDLRVRVLAFETMGETSLYKPSVPMARTGQREETDPRGDKGRGALGGDKGGALGTLWPLCTKWFLM